MRIESTCDADHVWAAVWLEGFSDPGVGGNERFDAVKLCIGRRTGIARAEILLDLGYPVLQPQSATVSLDDRTRERFLESLERPADAAAAAESLSFAVLALRANVSLRDGAEPQPAERVATGIAEFDAFFAAGAHAEPVSAGGSGRGIQLSERALTAGVRLGILDQSVAGISCARQVSLQAESNTSALAAAAAMAADRAQFGAALPQRFHDIDVNAATAALRSIEIPTAAAVCFFGDTAVPWHERRLQAAQAYPLFAERFAHDDQFRTVIDSGRSLSSAVAQRFGLKRGHLRRIRKLTAPIPANRVFEHGVVAQGADPLGVNRTRRYSLGGGFSLDRFIELMNGYHADWVPDNDGGWNDFIDVMSSCALPLHASFGVPVETLLITSRGDWSGFKSALAAAFDTPIQEFDRRGLALATSDACETVDDFCRCVVLPQLLSSITEAGEPPMAFP